MTQLPDTADELRAVAQSLGVPASEILLSSDATEAGRLRQNIANIGIFVINQTLNVIGNPRPERLRSLININRQLAAGLNGSA